MYQASIYGLRAHVLSKSERLKRSTKHTRERGETDLLIGIDWMTDEEEDISLFLAFSLSVRFDLIMAMDDFECFWEL